MACGRRRFAAAPVSVYAEYTKCYNFLNAGSEAEFDEYIKEINALALYDTGIAALYGDALLTLVTCAYHTENGQFVVVAKRVNKADIKPPRKAGIRIAPNA